MKAHPQRTQLARIVAEEFSRRLQRVVRPEYLEQVILIRHGYCWGWSYRFGELVATYVCEEGRLHIAQQDQSPVILPLSRDRHAA